MDDIQLKRLWQNYIIHQPEDSLEKRKCLTKLLEICMIYFVKQEQQQNASSPEGSGDKVKQCQTAYNFIGKWLIPQFIIDINNAYSTENKFDCDFDFLNNYFVADIGGKLLKCIYYLNTRSSYLYNYELIKILVPILKQYILNISARPETTTTEQEKSGEGQQPEPTTKCTAVFGLDSFLEKYRFNEQIFLKSFKSDILSPVKVKSWIKDQSAHLHHNQPHQQHRHRANQIKLSSSIPSSSTTAATISNNRRRADNANPLDSDTEYHDQSIEGNIPRCRLKYQTLCCEHKFFCLSKVNNDGEGEEVGGEGSNNNCENKDDHNILTQLINYDIANEDGETYLKKQSKYDIVYTIMEILFDFIRHESKQQQLHPQTSNDTGSGGGYLHQESLNLKLSTLVIVELTELLREICDYQGSFGPKDRNLFQLVCYLKELIVASCLTVCRTTNGVKVIHKFKIFELLVKLLGKINWTIQDKNSGLEEDFVEVLNREFYDTYCLSIQLLTHIANSLRHTTEFGTFFILMKEFFDSNNGEETLISLITNWEKGHDGPMESSRGEYELIYRLVDLLQVLQISLQRSHSLYLHRQICTKQRHNRCDLTPLMVHHFYHEKTFDREGVSARGSQSTCSTSNHSRAQLEQLEILPCCPSMIYNVLINLIFLFSKQNNNESVDKLVCYICNHLCFLISCCWSLKHYFKRLLYFAVNVNRSNVIRNAIFNIIEFSIKTQRSHLFSTVFMLERCNYCMYEDLCDTNEVPNSAVPTSTDQPLADSNTSEGYLTDNGNSSLTKLPVNIVPLDPCSNSNCLIKSLSAPYFNLLKSQDAAGRQAVFRHFYNLFSYLSTNSKLSLLNHIVLPVFQNFADFTLDVSIFTLNLLVFISDTSNREGKDLNLLSLFSKIDGLSVLRQLFLGNHFEKNNEQPFTPADISFLSLQLVGNFIRLELSQYKSNTGDVDNLNSLSMLLGLLEEHFSMYTGRSSVLHNFRSSLFEKPTNIEEFIEHCKQKSLNLSVMSPAEVNQLYSNLFLLFHLLNILHSILNQFEFFPSILNHEHLQFSVKIYCFFQSIFRLAINEIHLYQLVAKQHINDPLLAGRFSSFFGKILRIIEQLLSILLKLKPFNVEKKLYSTKEIAKFIKIELGEFINENILANVGVTNNSTAVDPMNDLLGMLVNISFNNCQKARCFTKNDLDKSIILGECLHPRSTSFDSLMSDNDTNNESNACTEKNDMDYGYEADTELNKSEMNLKASDTMSKSSHVSQGSETKVIATSKVEMKFVDICRVVIEHLIEAFHMKNELCRNRKANQQLMTTQLNSILTVINIMIKNCKDNLENCRILFEANFAQFLVKGFRLIFDSNDLEKKSIKVAIFELFVEISRVQLRPAELGMFIDLFKMENADYEFLLANLNKLLFSKPNELARPRFSVKYPHKSSNSQVHENELKGKVKNWIDLIISNINYNCDINENDLMSFKSMACILPIENELSTRHFSLVFWVYLHKIQPLIDKSKPQSQRQNISSEFDDTESRFLKTSLIHIISVAFNSSTIELWYNYIYNKFVYRVCKENNGRVIYSSENFVTNNANTLGRWNCVRVNFSEVPVIKTRTFFLQIAHCINSSKDKIVKLAYTPNIFTNSKDKVALLLGSKQTIPQFHYRLANVMLFKEHLNATSTILLYSFGSDFAHLHHLKNESITNDNYFVLPKQLVKEYQVDIISSMLHCSSSSVESRWLLDNILLLYKASHPTIYFTYTQRKTKMAPFMINFSRLYSTSRVNARRNLSHLSHTKTNQAKLCCDIRLTTNYGIAKTIADTGGVSVFLFMFCYLFERSNSAAVQHKAMEMLLKIYDSHYFHRLMFDTQYNGYKLMLYTLEKSERVFQTNMLKTFAQFSLDFMDCHPLILSSNVETFINSWRVWIRNASTMRVFFSTLHSLVVNTNPYRNYNLEQLQKVDAFERLLLIIKDIYVNLLDNDCNQLDADSIAQLMMILKQMFDCTTTGAITLFKSLFQCLLLLHKSEQLQVNQSRASFYYLFPSTSLVYFDHSSEAGSDKNLVTSDERTLTSLSQMLKTMDSSGADNASVNMDDWEIVSEVVDASASASSVFQSNKDNLSLASSGVSTAVTGKLSSNSSNQQVITELILLVNKLIDQIGDVNTLEAVVDQLSCMDLLICFVNSQSDKVREAAFSTFIKFYRMFYEASLSSTDPNVQGRTLANRTLHLLLISNQLYRYLATEEIVNLSLKFLLNLSRKYSIDLLNIDNSVSFVKLVELPSLESFIPFLALLPKCHHSIGFCLKVLATFRRIVDSLSLEQIFELQKDYGLVQSISKLVINFNTYTPITSDDINKYTKEQVNEEVGKIMFTISYNYVLMDGSQYFHHFISLTHYFLIMERKVAVEIVPIFRQLQVSILQAAFEAVTKFQLIYINTRSSFSDYDYSSNTYLLTNQTDLASLSRDSSSQRFRDFCTEKSKNITLVQPKEMSERVKFVVKKSTNFIVCRDDVTLTSKEKYFQREVLYHSLEFVQNAENLQPNWIDKLRSSKNPWIYQLQLNKDFLKTELCKIVLFLISPFQTVDDRIFALHRFAEKTSHFENVRLFVDKNNDKFGLLFQAFVADLSENGVTKLSIYDLKTYSEDDYPTRFNELFNSSIPQVQGESLSIKFVQEKFAAIMTNSKEKLSAHVKEEISTWYNQLQEDKKEFEKDIMKHVNKLFVNMTLVYKKVLETAGQLNEKVVLSQHREEKEYFNHIRMEYARNSANKKKVLNLVNELLHERSVWHLNEHYPQTWTLSPFESANRVRKRLERCFLEMEPRYVRGAAEKRLKSKRLFNFLLECKSNPFSQTCSNTIHSSDLSQSMNSSLLYATSAKVVLFDEEIEGEILITNQNVRFLSNQTNRNGDINFSSKKAFFHEFHIDFLEVQEFTKCKYELQHNAMEIYLSTGLTYLLVFESTVVRDEFIRHLMSNKERMPNLIESLNLVSLTQMWRERRISNFEYLTNLNKLSGRTLNDLMQYPVFPFVLSDYQSDQLNLKEADSYRILSRPIAVQKKEREKHYVDQYNYIKMENERNRMRETTEEEESFQFVVTSSPYHYGAHYSNSGIVLHYLVRLPPYTQMFLQYQDKNFDIPDRTFHSIQTTWRLATEDSTNGFKELIPEFFSLPEFLKNDEDFNLGIRQNGEKVDDVILPPWSRNDARLFTLINRQALESNYVTQHLHYWIDLTFGYQQRGKPAVDAINVFHPATHFSSDLSKIKDDVKRQAIKTMIKTFGQMPTQLFNMPHPNISAEVMLPVELDPEMRPNSIAMNEVIGIKWGVYMGSPIFGKPKISFQKKLARNFGRLWALPTNDILLLPNDSCLLVAYNQQRNVYINTLYIVSYFLVVWAKPDSTLWIRNNEDYHLFMQENLLLDQICLCESIPDYDWILIGYQSGIIISFSLKSFRNPTSRVEVKQRYALVGHRSPITSITINKNFSVMLSTDSGGTAILWDMNKQQYIRTIIEQSNDDPPKEICLSCISDTLGDLALIQYSRENDMILSSRLNVFTINGQPIGEVSTKRQHPYFTALCYSTATEGLSVNVIATGLSDGNVKLWSSWDLTLVREVRIDAHLPVKNLVYSHLNDFLYITFEDNLLISLENSPPLFGSQTAYLSASNATRILDLT